MGAQSSAAKPYKHYSINSVMALLSEAMELLSDKFPLSHDSDKRVNEILDELDKCRKTANDSTISISASIAIGSIRIRHDELEIDYIKNENSTLKNENNALKKAAMNNN